MNWVSEKEIEKILNEVIEKFLIPKYDELGLRASGNWANQLRVKAKPNGGEILGEKYTEQLVYGRKPGVMPPINMIAEWVKRRGIKANPWAVAKNIAKNGTRLHQNGGSDLLEVLEEKETIDFINSKLASFMQTRVQLKIVRLLKKTLVQ